MRPAYFGEVIFPRSRAVDIEYGDDFEETCPPKYDVILEQKANIADVASSTKYLVLACEPHPSNFAKVYLIPDDPKPDIAFSIKVYPHVQPGGEKDDKKQAVIAIDFCYNAAIGCLIGLTVFNRAPSLEWAPLVTAKIFNHLAAAASRVTVYALDFKPSALFQTLNRSAVEEKLSTCGLFRRVKSSKQQDSDDVTELEMPNVIDGLAASVITHCELAGIPATANVLYGPNSGDAIVSNITSYYTSLQRVKVWKDTLLRQVSESVAKAKLQELLRRNAPLSTVFG